MNSNENAAQSMFLRSIFWCMTTVAFAGCSSQQFSSSKAVLHLSRWGGQAFSTDEVQVSKNGSLTFFLGKKGKTSILDKNVFAVSFRAHSKVTAESISTLPTLSSLKVLSFGDCQLPQGFAEIVSSCNALEILNVAGASFDDVDLGKLNVPNSLKMIDLFQSEVSAIGISKFQQKHPDIKVLNWYH